MQLWVKWTDLAKRDLEHIETYLTEQTSAVFAIDYLLSVLTTIDNVIKRFPEAGRPGLVSGTREWVMPRSPFILVYRYVQSDQSIEVIRVLHHSRSTLQELF